MDQTFGKNEKLKSKVLINRLFAEGKSINKYPLKLIYIPLCKSEPGNLKTAVSVPKRNFKKAVDRVYLKRLMREAFRKNKYLVTSDLNSSFALMFIYTAREKVPYERLLFATEDILNRLSGKINTERDNEKHS